MIVMIVLFKLPLRQAPNPFILKFLEGIVLEADAQR